MDTEVQNMMNAYGVTSATERFLLKDQRMFLNGVFVESEDKSTIDVTEPATATENSHKSR